MFLIQETHEKDPAPPLGHTKSGRFECELPNHIFPAQRLINSSFDVILKLCGSKAGNVLSHKRSGLNGHNRTHQFWKHVANITRTRTITSMAERLARRTSMHHVNVAAILAPIDLANIAVGATKDSPFWPGSAQYRGGVFHDFKTRDMLESGTFKPDVHTAPAREKTQRSQAVTDVCRHQCLCAKSGDWNGVFGEGALPPYCSPLGGL
jgi:hypothetical protein